MLFDTMGGVSMVLCSFNEGWLYQPKSYTGKRRLFDQGNGAYIAMFFSETIG